MFVAHLQLQLQFDSYKWCFSLLLTQLNMHSALAAFIFEIWEMTPVNLIQIS